MHVRSRFWLCLPPVAFALLDYILTLTGQPAAYWDGNYEAAEEGNPLARVFLVWHPWAFVFLGAAWLALICLALRRLPPATAKLTCLLITFAHAVGASSWLWRLGWVGVILTGVAFLAAERLVDWAWRPA